MQHSVTCTHIHGYVKTVRKSADVDLKNVAKVRNFDSGFFHFRSTQVADLSALNEPTSMVHVACIHMRHGSIMML